MQGIRCPTTRPAIATEREAATIALRVLKGATAKRCPYCGWWHVVGINSLIEQPSPPRQPRS